MTVGAVILAAGFGTRLAPLTDHTPKPLLEVGGRPVATHLVERLRELDPDLPIVVVVNGRHPEAWNAWCDSSPGRVAVSTNGVLTDGERLGAVADLARGLEGLPEVETVVVLAGDNLIGESLAPHLAVHQADGQPLVLCRDLGDEVPPGRFGEVTVDAAGCITRFREKPDDPDSPLAATCTYVLPGARADTLVHEYLGGGGDADSPGRFIAWLASREPVRAAALIGTYFDIGNHETLAEARRTFDGV